MLEHGRNYGSAHDLHSRLGGADLIWNPLDTATTRIQNDTEKTRTSSVTDPDSETDRILSQLDKLEKQQETFSLASVARSQTRTNSRSILGVDSGDRSSLYIKKRAHYDSSPDQEDSPSAGRGNPSAKMAVNAPVM